MAIIEGGLVGVGIDSQKSFNIEKDVFTMSLEEIYENNRLNEINNKLTDLLDHCDELKAFVLSFEDTDVQKYLVEIGLTHKGGCSSELKKIQDDFSMEVTSIILQ